MLASARSGSNSSYPQVESIRITKIRLWLRLTLGLFAALEVSAVAARAQAIGEVCGPSDGVVFVQNDATPIGKRSPLILVHGIHGVPNDVDLCENQVNGNRFWVATADHGYWNDFQSHLSSRGLDKYFKIYRVLYRSDHYTLTELGERMQSSIALATAFGIIPPQVQKFIVAHSMGGLVSRAYMATPVASGRAGDTVRLLITLGTPHHGTLLANALARNHFITSGWIDLFSLADVAYWTIAGKRSNATTPHQPNRSDLMWDFMANPTRNPSCDALNSYCEDNANLARLNDDRSFDSKLIAYAGDFDQTNEEFFTKLDLEQLFADALCERGLRPDNVICRLFNGTPTPLNDHDFLRILGSFLANGLRGNDQIPQGLVKNDGFVPVDSATFWGHRLKKPAEVLMPMDHLDMLTSPLVFRRVVDDLVREVAELFPASAVYDKILLKNENAQSAIYWIQSGKRYELVAGAIGLMSGVSGWGADQISTVPQDIINSIPLGPVFLEATSRSEGLLIRDRNTSRLYVITAGKKSYVQSELLLIGAGYNPSHIIEVSPAVAKMFSDGPPIEASTGHIHGRVVIDLNSNGKYDSGEPFAQSPNSDCSGGLPIVSLHVRWTSSKTWGSTSVSECNTEPLTGSNAPFYSIGPTASGTYTLQLEVPYGWRVTGGNGQIVNVNAGQTANSAWFLIAEDRSQVSLEISATELCIGSPWTLTISNAPPGSTVNMNAWKNGDPEFSNQTIGVIGAGGTLVLTGLMEPGSEGSWYEEIYIGGFRSTSISFKVTNCSDDALPGISLNRPNYCLGEKWTLNVKGKADSQINLFGSTNGSPWSVLKWARTNAEGVYSASDKIGTGSLGNHSVHVTIAGQRSNTAKFAVSECAMAPPRITNIDPAIVPSDVQKWLLVTGTGFQPGFSAQVIVDGRTYKIASEGTLHVSDDEVRVSVRMSGRPNRYVPILKIINSDDQSAVLGFTVEGIARESDFDLSVSPPTQFVKKGDSVSFSISLESLGGFGGSISLVTSGMPPGSNSDSGLAASTVTVNSGSSQATALLIKTTSATPASTSTITVTATNGSITKSASVKLTVIDNATSAAPTARFSMTAQGQTKADGQTLALTVPVNGSVMVVFDGNSSTASNQTRITNWVWKSNGTQICGNSPSCAYEFGTPSNTITLSVTDNNMQSATATGLVTLSFQQGAQTFTGTPSAGQQLTTTFSYSGTGWTPNATIHQKFQAPNGNVSTGTISADGTGNVGWTYVYKCYDAPGTWYTWIVDPVKGESARVVNTVTAHPNCNVTPTFTGSPMSGQQITTAFNYSGTGLTPNASIQQRFRAPNGAVSNGTVQSDSAGNVSWTYYYKCSDAPGNWYTWIIDPAKTYTSSEVLNVVSAHPSCTPSTFTGSPSSGQQLTTTFSYSGTGWTPNVTIQQKFQAPNGSVSGGTIQSDSNGNVNWTYVYKCTDAPGLWYTWIVDPVKGESSKVANNVSAHPSCGTPTFTGSPTTGQQLTTAFNYSGAGLTPNTTIQQRFQAPNGAITNGNIQSDANGNVAWVYYYKCADAPGTWYTWIIDSAKNYTGPQVANTVSANPSCASPTFTGSPSSGQQLTTTFSYSGTGWTPSVTIQQKFQDPNGAITSGTISSNGNGNFNWTYVYKCSDAPGTWYTWIVDPVKGESSKVTNTVSANSSCSAPTFTGTPSSGQQLTTTFSYSGTGWTPNTTIQQKFQAPNGAVTGGTIQSDGSGNVSWTYVYKCTDAPGLWYTWVVDPIKGESSKVTNNVSANPTCTPATFSGSPSSGQQLTTTFSYSGAGWTPNTAIQQKFQAPNGAVTGGTIQSNGGGNFSWTYVYKCTDAPGTWYTWIVDPLKGESTKVTNIVSSNPSCTPATFSGSPSTGQQLTTVFSYTGASWTPNVTIQQKFQAPNGAITGGTISSNGSGGFGWTYTYKCTDAPGLWYTWIVDPVKGESNKVANTVSANPSCTPATFTGSPSTGQQLITIFSYSGTGWTPNATIQQKFQAPNGVITGGTIQSNSSGNFTWTYTYKCSDLPGTWYTWIVDPVKGISSSVVNNVSKHPSCP